jgi:hypothetical protein
MKPDYKIRQEIYHRLTTEFDDDLATKDIEMSNNVEGNAIRYFTDRDIGWIYPAKSYMVGICYARWLSEHFGGRAVEYLEDPDLLHGNDPYFVQYSTDPGAYHRILTAIGGWGFDINKGMVPDVYQYFREEFMLDD